MYAALVFLLSAEDHEHSVVSQRLTDPLLAAFKRRDYDGDGLVSAVELSAGILSSCEQYEPPTVPLPVYPFGEIQCADPTLDALSFLECTTAQARAQLLSYGGSPFSESSRPNSIAVQFSAALATFLGGCHVPSWRSGSCMASCSECAALEKGQSSKAWNTKGRERTNGSIVSNGTKILISSDWHVEPW